MKQYRFLFYSIDEETDEILAVVSQSFWAYSDSEAWMKADDWAYRNVYQDYEMDEEGR